MVCNTLFCIAEQHEDDLHVDATGYTWHEELSPEPVVAHVYTAQQS